MKCVCGQEYKEFKQNVTTKYKEKNIKILSVPCFICKSDHVKMSMETRKQIRLDLKNAYKKGLTEMQFKLYS